MLEWIITSCVLIGIVLLVRLCLKNKISLRLRYALWLIVLVRLLVPVNFFNSSMSVMNVVQESATVAELQQPENTYIPPTEPMTDTPVTQVPILPVNPTPITPVTPEVEEPVQLPQAQIPTQEAPPEKSFSVTLLLQIIWIAGIAITGGVFLFANIRFALRLKRTREAQNADCPLRVYRTAMIDTPCLFGIFRPAIYLTEQAGEDEGQHHILTHEMTHYRHLDHIWGLLRCLCLVLHWYNPLVWVAAICSRRDSELACDEAVIKQLGEDSRAEYGKTLIRMTCTKQNAAGIFTTATTMTGSKKTIKNRIKLIVKHPKTALYAVICLVIVAAIAVGCTFTGAKSPEESVASAETTPEETENTEGKTESEPEETTIPEEETAIVTDKRPAEVLTKSYSLKDLRSFMDDEEMFYTTYSTHPSGRKLSLSGVHDKFPIECIKGKYIVYSVEEGGYFYVFMDIWDAYKVGKQVDLSDTYVNDTMYVSRVCDLSDFDSIEIGKSTYQDVKDIDPNTEGYVSSADDYDIQRSHNPLSDGRMLDITYERNENTNSEIVVDIQINPIHDEPSPYWWTNIQYEDWPVDAVKETEVINESMFPKVLECGEAEGYVTLESLTESKTCRVYARKYRNPDNPYSYDLYVDIDTGTEILSKHLESNVFQVPEVGLLLGDVDGDDVEEILIHSNTGGGGGFGLWMTWVLDVEDGEIQIIFENFDEFDTGFEGQFLEDYRLEITNQFTGYELVFYVKDWHKGVYKSAKEPPTGYALDVDPFCFFEPEDVDHDGVCEIVCRQYTSYIGHSDYTGIAHSVLKFNTQTQKFEVIDAWFEPYLGAGMNNI